MFDEYFAIPDAKILFEHNGGKAVAVRSPMFYTDVHYIPISVIREDSPVATINDAEGEMWVHIKFAKMKKWIE